MGAREADAAPVPGDTARASLRDLILVLADSKRLLGMRYAGWILGAPELETGIACASMAQDEWGHGRLLYALLKDFGDDISRVEHDRDAGEYRNIEVLDQPAESWSDLVALNALVDAALAVQLEALTTSSYAPVRQRVGKLLEEEHFHAAHGAAWFRRLAQNDAGREALTQSAARVLPVLLRWFGPDAGANETLRAAAVMNASGSELRARFVKRIEPLLAGLDVDSSLHESPDFTGFDETRRRTSPGGPDAATISRVRGDKNRVFLMD
jgi:ring-1,2-phenylacetyl-CoA epoxidase subunit PaaC